MDGPDVHQADVNTFGGEGIACSEVVQLLELAANVCTHHRPVSWTTQSGSVDDVCYFQQLVEQGDVSVSEVDRCTRCSSEVVVCTDCCCNDQVVDDFTVDFCNHFIGHKVGEGAFCVDVVNRLEVLCCFQGPAGLELSGDSCDAVTVDAQSNFWLEWVCFEIVLVVYPCDCACWERTSRQRDGDSASAVVELGSSGRGRIDSDRAGKFGAVANENGVWVAVRVEADLEAWYWVITIWCCVCFACVGFDDYGPCEYWAVCKRCTDDGSAADGCVFALYFLGAVVWVKCPAVLACVALGCVLTHDLRSGDGLPLAEGVSVPDVEDQAGRLAHWLDADEVICDKLWVRFADEGECKSGEVCNVCSGRLIFEDHRPSVGVPCIVLVFQNACHESELLCWDFAAFLQDRGPLFDESVLLALSQHGCLVGISDHTWASTFDQVLAFSCWQYHYYISNCWFLFFISG